MITHGRGRANGEAARDPPFGHDSIERMEFLLALRRRGIMRAEVLRAMDEVAREQFVGAQDHALAYGDHALPIACGQSISQPYIVAYMTEQLDLRPEHCVLEIGTGSGYQAAVLARIAREVISIERYRTLAQAARARLEAQGVKNVTVIVGDGMLGLKGRAPFDRILVTAATPEPPPALVAQLAQDGIMVVPLGPRDGPQRIVKLTKTNEGLARADLLAVRFVPLLPGKAHEL